MKMHRFLIIFLFLFSCSGSDHSMGNLNKTSSKYQLLSTNKTKKFDNRNEYYYTFSSQIKNNWLIRRKIRQENQGLCLINIENGEHKDLILTEDQVRELVRLRGFYYQNKDSIFLFGIRKLLLVNEKGETLLSIFFNPPQNDYFPILCSNNVFPFFVKNSLYFNKIIDKFPNNDYYKQNTIVSYDLITRNLNELPNTSYPVSYFDKCWFSVDLNISFCKNDRNEIIFSYPISDSLYVYSIDKKRIIKKVKARSKYKKGKTTSADCDMVWDNKAYYKHVYKNLIYRDIIYDPYRNVYYRIVSLPKKDYNINKPFNSLNLPFSIQVFDDELNFLCETEILNESPKYIKFDYFVDNEGLWISVNNPDNPEFDENELKFDLFQLKSS